MKVAVEGKLPCPRGDEADLRLSSRSEMDPLDSSTEGRRGAALHLGVDLLEERGDEAVLDPVRIFQDDDGRGPRRERASLI